MLHYPDDNVLTDKMEYIHTYVFSLENRSLLSTLTYKYANSEEHSPRYFHYNT